jgi:transcriptional regulator with XRE-family HTH domain
MVFRVYIESINGGNDMLLADRLQAFRKRFGYSQEFVANKVGVSRQAVFNRESGESSPSLDNLKALASLYYVSLDDLVNLDKDIDLCYKKEEKVKDGESAKGVHIQKDGASIHVDISDGARPNFKKTMKVDFLNISGMIRAITLTIIVALYIILGVIYRQNNFGWKVFWPLFILLDFPSSIYRAIKRKRFSAVQIRSIALATYLFLGMYGSVSDSFNGWHPYWLILLIIPIYSSIFSSVDKIVRFKKIKKSRADKGDDVVYFSEDDDDDDNDEDDD